MTPPRVLVPDDAALGAEERAHVARMRGHLAEQIAANAGWISFERYMDLALYAAGLGYYSAGAHKLGEGGDFTTAPELSALFGRCLAQQCAVVLRELRGRSVKTDDPVGAAAPGRAASTRRGAILEIGAGTGRLAVDLLSGLEERGELPERYCILEISADLRERQRRLIETRIPHLYSRVEWLDAPPPQSFDGVILANEVLDALPVARFRWHADRCEELGVGLEQGRLVWAARPAGDAMRGVCNALREAGGGWDDGYESEYCPRLEHWAHTVTRPLAAGMVLWIDYGLPRRQYYFRERREGTLMCHFRQRAHADPFLHPGLSDITAWVDFTSLAHASRSGAWRLEGFTTQAHFLAGLDIEREMHGLAGGDANRFARLAGEARRLMLPGEMGERFKVMAWTRGLAGSWPAFELLDLRHTL